MKTILIAVPTNKYIVPETMKSIYDQEIPEGYKATFQFFYGYQIDQIRNLIADWAKNFDFLFAVDSDVSFPPDTLKRLLAREADVVSGLYIQRKPGVEILEIYKGGRNVPYMELLAQGDLVEIDSCGFGCVLVDSDVIRDLAYPHFVYTSAIDHANTISEDTYFCAKARARGWKIYADTTIVCNHHGDTIYAIQMPKAPVKVDPKKVMSPKEIADLLRLRELESQRLLPAAHVNYLKWMRQQGVQPKVIYDIGACVLHWTKEARVVWPDAEFIAFEAMEASKDIFIQYGIRSCIAALTDVDGRELTFYQNTYHPGGNSYYKENPEVNPNAEEFFNESHAIKKIGRTLDSLIAERNLPMPDMIKMDVQGAELDVLKGASNALETCKHLILELQKVEYNKGAPLKDEVIDYLQTIGFFLISRGPFSDNGPDGDYHFFRPV